MLGMKDEAFRKQMMLRYQDPDIDPEERMMIMKMMMQQNKDLRYGI